MRVVGLGGCTSYCDILSWPTTDDLGRMPPSFVAVVGVHPKHFKKGRNPLTSDSLELLAALLRHPRVVGLGEIGLDFSVGWDHWAAQMEGFHSLLRLVGDDQVVVIHCRSEDADCPTMAPHWHLWKWLTLHCLGREGQGQIAMGFRQRLVLHSYAGDFYTPLQTH